jgi:hypothetical protein
VLLVMEGTLHALHHTQHRFPWHMGRHKVWTTKGRRCAPLPLVPLPLASMWHRLQCRVDLGYL